MSDTEKSASSNNKFLKGTLILTVSSIVVKVIGSLNWIILSRVLGGEGIGLARRAARDGTAADQIAGGDRDDVVLPPATIDRCAQRQ